MRCSLRQASVQLFRVVIGLFLISGIALFLGGWSPPRSQSSERRIVLGKAKPGFFYGVTVAIKNPAQFQNKSIERFHC